MWTRALLNAQDNDNARHAHPMAYLQKSTSAGFDYGGFFKQELAKQHAKTQQALVPQTASGSGCNLDDARTGDAAWKCNTHTMQEYLSRFGG